MVAAVISEEKHGGVCALRLKPIHRMDVSFKDGPRYKLTTVDLKARIFPSADLRRISYCCYLATT